jgi:hypothetical protein
MKQFVPRLVPPGAAFDRERSRLAANRNREIRKGSILGGIGIKDLINKGRP